MKVESVTKVVGVTVTLSEEEAEELKRFIGGSQRYLATPIRDFYNGLVIALRKT